MKDYSVLENMKKNTNVHLEAAYNRGYKQGLKDGKEEGYQRGINVVWNYLRKFKIAEAEDPESLHKYLDNGLLFEYVDYGTASEFIEKMRGYEKERKEKELKEDKEIKVGDEVQDEIGGAPVIVTAIQGDVFHGIYNSGFLRVFRNDFNHWHKTGRHFDIEKILEKMKDD